MIKKKIYFLEKSIPFSPLDINSTLISGSEKTLINITGELGKNNNFEIYVFNLIKKSTRFNNVEWINLNSAKDYENPDYLISMSDANLLSSFNCSKNYLWSHSVQPIEKFIRKKQLYPFLKHKPKMILESVYHYNNRSFLTSFFGKEILPIAVDYDFINQNIDKNAIPKKNAIFTTRSDRNLDFLLECWNEIFKYCPDSALYINPPFELNEHLKNKNVIIRTKGNKKKLINDMLLSKVMLNPGHKGEVFCLAAEEARELCIPIVTMGYGALKERVEHGITGFIAKNMEEFINFSVKLLNDNALYLQIKNNLIGKRNIRNYKNVADDFYNILNK